MYCLSNFPNVCNAVTGSLYYRKLRGSINIMLVELYMFLRLDLI